MCLIMAMDLKKVHYLTIIGFGIVIFLVVIMASIAFLVMDLPPAYVVMMIAALCIYLPVFSIVGFKILSKS